VLIGDGQVMDDVAVDIGRPRDLDTVTSDPRYQQLYERLRELLR